MSAQRSRPVIYCASTENDQICTSNPNIGQTKMSINFAKITARASVYLLSWPLFCLIILNCLTQWGLFWPTYAGTGAVLPFRKQVSHDDYDVCSAPRPAFDNWTLQEHRLHFLRMTQLPLRLGKWESFVAFSCLRPTDRPVERRREHF